MCIIISRGKVVNMHLDAINARVEEIRDDKENIGRFVEEYKPFIASCAGKAAGRYVSYGTDDELSIAMAAFVEAINSFDRSKGNFFTFSRNVIKRRLIDYYRSEKRHSNVISLNHYLEEREEDFDLSSEEAVKNYSEQRLAELRKLELEELGRELAQWDITFRDLARASPKHIKTRQQCAELAGAILSTPEVLRTVMTKKYMPVAELERISGLPRKLIERFRKYIIAVVVIAIGDYEYIKDYIKL